MRTTLAAATVAASVIGGSAAALVLTPGIAGAQDDAGDAVEQTEESSRRGARLDALAENLGMDAEDVKEALRNGSTIADLATQQGVDVQIIVDAMVDAANERLAQAVEDGRLTQEQADDKAAQAEDRATAIVNGEADFGKRRHHRARIGQGLATAADVIGVEVSDLRDAIQNDGSIADVATNNGVEVQAVIDAIVADREAHLSDAVENGRIDQERADEIAAGLEDRVTDVVNGEFERPGRGFRGGNAPTGDVETAELPA